MVFIRGCGEWERKEDDTGAGLLKSNDHCFV